MTDVLSEHLESHRRLLRALVWRVTGVAADADEIVQETYLRALTKPPPDLSRCLRPWLMRVAMNLARDRLRARRRQHDRNRLLRPRKDTRIFDGEVIAVVGDVGQGDDYSRLEEKAINCGASKLYVADLKKEFVEEFIWPTLKAGAKLSLIHI